MADINIVQEHHLAPEQARAAAQLPAGHFQFTKTGKHLRLEWTPDLRRGLSAVVREVTLP